MTFRSLVVRASVALPLGACILPANEKIEKIVRIFRVMFRCRLCVVDPGQLFAEAADYALWMHIIV